MAATAVYARIAEIPTGSKSQNDAVAGYTNISATTGAFTLTGGGLYGVTVKASTYGTVTLQILGPDDTTWLTALTAFSADGYATVYLPPGQFRFAVG